MSDYPAGSASYQTITAEELPPAALALMSDEQRSYLDEFEFRQCISPASPDRIEAWYAGQLLATWNGTGWVA